MSKIIIEFESVGEKELTRSFGALEKSASEFEKSVTKSGKAAGKSAAELDNLAKLNERLARIQIQQSKGALTASQAQVGASKARIAALVQETAILVKQGASRDKIAATTRKLTAEQVKLAAAEQKLSGERQKATQKQVTDQAKLVAIQEKAAASAEKAIQKQLAGQAKLAAAQSKSAAQAEQLAQREAVNREKVAAAEAKAAASAAKAAQQQTQAAQKRAAADAKAAQIAQQKAVIDQNAINLAQRLTRIQEAQAKGQLTSSQAAIGASKAKQLAFTREAQLLTEMGASQAKIATATQKAAAEKAKAADLSEKAAQREIAARAKAAAQSEQLAQRESAARQKAAAAAEKAAQRELASQAKLAAAQAKAAASAERAAQQQTAAAQRKAAADAKSAQAAQQRAAIDQNAANLAQRLARIQDSLAKGQISASQAAIGASKAKQLAYTKEAQILTQAGASQAKIAQALQRATTAKVQAVQQSEKYRASLQGVAAAQAKSAQAEQQAALKARANANLYKQIAQIQKQQASGAITAGQAAIKISDAKVKAIRQEIVILKQQGASVDVIAKANQRLAGEQLKGQKATQNYTKSLTEKGKAAKGAAGGLSLVSAGVAGIAAAGATKALNALGAGLRFAADQAKASVEEFAALQQSLTTFRAISGLGETDKQFQAIEAEVRRLGATTVFTSRQMGELSVNLLKGGLDAAQVEQALSATANAALASGTELEEMGRIVTSVANVTLGGAKSLEDFNRVADVLVLTANSTATNVADLGEAMKNVGPLAKKLGFEIEDTAAFMGLLANAGISGAEAGTALRGALNRLGPGLQALQGNTENQLPSQKRFADGLRGMGLSVEDFTDATGKVDASKAFNALADGLTSIEDPTRAAAVVIGLFGQEYGSKMLGVLEQSPEAFRQLVSDLKNAGGTAAETAEIMQTSLAAQFEILNSSIAALRERIGASLEPVLTPLVTELQGFFNSMVASFETVSGPLSGALVGAFGVAIDQIKAAFGQIDFGFIADIAESLAPAFAGVAKAIQQIDLGENIGRLVQEGGEVVAQYFAQLGPTIGRYLEGAVSFVGAFVEGIQSLITAARQMGIIDAIFTGANAALTPTIAIMNALTGIISGLSGALQVLGPALTVVGFTVKTVLLPMNLLLAALQGASVIIRRVGVVLGDLGRVAEGTRDAIATFFLTSFGKPIQIAIDAINTLLKAWNAIPGLPKIELPGVDEMLGDLGVKAAEEQAKSLVETAKATAAAEEERLAAMLAGGAGVEEIAAQEIAVLKARREAMKAEQDALAQDSKVAYAAMNAEIEAALKSREITEEQAALRRAQFTEDAARAQLDLLRESGATGPEIANQEKVLQNAQRARRGAEEALKAAEEQRDAAIGTAVESLAAQDPELAAAVADRTAVEVEDATAAVEEQIALGGEAIADEAGALGEAAGEGIEQGLAGADVEGVMDDQTNEIADAAAEQTKALEDERQKRLDALGTETVEAGLDIKTRVQGGEITQAEGESQTADLALKTAQEELKILEETNASAKELADQRVKIEEAKSAAIKAERASQLDELKAAETALNIELETQLADREITSEAAGTQRAELAAENAQKELGILENTGASEAEIQAARLNVLKAQADQREAIQTEALSKVAAAEQKKLDEIRTLELQGVLSTEQAESAKAAAAVESAEARIAALKKAGATEEEIQAAQMELLEAQKGQREAITAEAIANVEKLERQRLNDIAALELSGALSTEQAEAAKAKASVETAKQRIAALKATGATEEEIQQASLDLLGAQRDAEQALIAVLESRIDTQTELIQGGLQTQIDAIEGANRALERQSQILGGITALESSNAKLGQTFLGIQIEQAKAAESLVAKRDELLGKNQELTEEQQKALDLEITQSEMRDRGIDPNKTAVQLLKERQALEDRLAASQLAAQEQEFSRQRQALEIESQLSEAAARRAVIEARIAEAAAQQEAIKARIAEQGLREDLRAAQAAGDSDRVAEIKAQLELNKLQQDAALLAQQNTQDAIANVEATRQLNELKRQSLTSDQQAALYQGNAAENERRLAAAAERQRAGEERGPVDLLPTEGELLNTDQDAENAQTLRDTDQQITDEAQRQNELSEERQALNAQEIAQQQELLRLQQQRNRLQGGGGGSPEIPGFKDGGSFRAGTTAIVGEAGPELVRFGPAGYVYNAQKTAQILRNLPSAVSPTARATPTPASSGSDLLLKEIKAMRRELGKAPRPMVVNQQNTANLRNLDQQEVSRIVRRSHEEGIEYLKKFL